jgi:NADH:ubiquinone oxidoreductase subunit
MKNIVVTLLIFSCFTMFAQVNANLSNIQTKLDNLSTQTNAPIIPLFDLRYEGIKGSRFFNEEYSTGEIWMTNNRHYTTEMEYKFDEHENGVQVKFKSTGKEITLFNNEVEIFKLKMNGKEVTYFKAEVPGESDANKLFQVIFLGDKYKLIKLPSKKLVRHDEKGNSYVNTRKYDEFEDNSRYFIKTNDKDFREIKFKKSAFMKTIADKKQQLEKIFNQKEYKGDLSDVMIAEVLQIISKDNKEN